MDKWNIISSLSKNKPSIGDRLLINNKEYTIEKMGSTTVYLSNNKSYPRKLFKDWWQLMLKHRQLKQSFDDRKHSIELWEAEQSRLGDVNPIPSLRFIIYRTKSGANKFFFAKGHSSHSGLWEDAKQFMSGYGDDPDYCTGGGFYTWISGYNHWKNFGDRPENMERSPTTLVLYGTSDSYGLNVERLDEAVQQNRFYGGDHDIIYADVYDMLYDNNREDHLFVWQKKALTK
jgi:hypothetical protein